MNDWTEAHFQCGTSEAARFESDAWEAFGLFDSDTSVAFYRDHRGDVWALPVSDIETDRPDFG